MDPAIIKGENKAINNWIDYGKTKNDEVYVGKEIKDKPLIRDINKKLSFGGFPINLVPSNVIEYLHNSKEISFNCFELEKITKGEELSFLLIYLFHEQNLFNELDINRQKFVKFIKEI